jgi:hypothetical protein
MLPVIVALVMVGVVTHIRRPCPDRLESERTRGTGARLPRRFFTDFTQFEDDVRLPKDSEKCTVLISFVVESTFDAKSVAGFDPATLLLAFPHLVSKLTQSAKCFTAFTSIELLGDRPLIFFRSKKLIERR